MTVIIQVLPSEVNTYRKYFNFYYQIEREILNRYYVVGILECCLITFRQFSSNIKYGKRYKIGTCL